MPDNSLAGHVAIVTGANHGIGASTATALATRGVTVLCTYLRLHDPFDPGTATVASMRTSGWNSRPPRAPRVRRPPTSALSERTSSIAATAQPGNG
jgi:hypothetical protein